jgi:hypothetical protein
MYADFRHILDSVSRKAQKIQHPVPVSTCEPNALNRYSLAAKSNSLKFNQDGSLMLYCQHASPGSDKESDWAFAR